ncbi:sulfur oxygenase reductase family protein [Acidihalobacter yilgarnensis]|uniref:sulfur oxygenase reductase family protein n=1 Tax=Acidihalobacter yilgarnensis TaxID=2819280 RepID=UPI0012E9A844
MNSQGRFFHPKFDGNCSRFHVQSKSHYRHQHAQGKYHARQFEAMMKMGHKMCITTRFHPEFFDFEQPTQTDTLPMARRYGGYISRHARYATPYRNVSMHRVAGRSFSRNEYITIISMKFMNYATGPSIC